MFIEFQCFWLSWSLCTVTYRWLSVFHTRAGWMFCPTKQGLIGSEPYNLAWMKAGVGYSLCLWPACLGALTIYALPISLFELLLIPLLCVLHIVAEKKLIGCLWGVFSVGPFTTLLTAMCTIGWRGLPLQTRDAIEVLRSEKLYHARDVVWMGPTLFADVFTSKALVQVLKCQTATHPEKSESVQSEAILLEAAIEANCSHSLKLRGQLLKQKSSMLGMAYLINIGAQKGQEAEALLGQIWGSLNIPLLHILQSVWVSTMPVSIE